MGAGDIISKAITPPQGFSLLSKESALEFAESFATSLALAPVFEFGLKRLGFLKPVFAGLSVWSAAKAVYQASQGQNLYEMLPSIMGDALAGGVYNVFKGGMHLSRIRVMQDSAGGFHLGLVEPDEVEDLVRGSLVVHAESNQEPARKLRDLFSRITQTGKLVYSDTANPKRHLNDDLLVGLGPYIRAMGLWLDLYAPSPNSPEVNLFHGQDADYAFFDPDQAVRALDLAVENPYLQNVLERMVKRGQRPPFQFNPYKAYNLNTDYGKLAQLSRTGDPTMPEALFYTDLGLSPNVLNAGNNYPFGFVAKVPIDFIVSQNGATVIVAGPPHPSWVTQRWTRPKRV